MFRGVLRRQGIEFEYLAADAPEEVWRAAITPRTRAIYTESIPNPLSEVIDLGAARRDRPRGRRAAHRGQHRRDPSPLPAVRVGRRHRHPLDVEVARRATAR